MSDSQPVLVSDAPSARRPARSMFVLVWIVLHAALLYSAVVTTFVWPLLAIIGLPVSYGWIMWWYRPPARSWGGWIVAGGVLGMVVAAKADLQGLSVSALMGLSTGVAPMLLLPWRGLRTWSWPIINMLGWIGAAAFMVWGGAHHLTTERLMVLSGAIYGSITGPALAILLDDDRPAVLSLILREDLPTT